MCRIEEELTVWPGCSVVGNAHHAVVTGWVAWSTPCPTCPSQGLPRRLEYQTSSLIGPCIVHPLSRSTYSFTHSTIQLQTNFSLLRIKTKMNRSVRYFDPQVSEINERTRRSTTWLDFLPPDGCKLDRVGGSEWPSGQNLVKGSPVEPRPRPSFSIIVVIGVTNLSLWHV